MRVLAAVILLALAPSAYAARPEPARAVDVARDGTTVVARLDYGATPSRPALSVRRDGGTPILLDRGREQKIFGEPVVAAGPGGRAVVAWSVLVSREGEATFNTTLKTVVAKAGGGFSRPVELGDADNVDVDINDAGDAAMVWVSGDNGAYRAYTAFAPAGHPFGNPVPLPDGEFVYDDLAVTSAGDAVIPAWPGAPALDAVTVRPDGTAYATRIADDSAFGVRFVADGAGHTLAVWSSPTDGQAVRTAVRAPDGTWSAPRRTIELPGSELAPPINPEAAVGLDGGAVVAATGEESPGDLGTLRVFAATGSLATGEFAPATRLGNVRLVADGGFPSVAATVGNGGAALVAYADSATRTVFTARATGGAFGTPAASACAGYLSDVFTRDGATLLHADGVLLGDTHRSSPCPPGGAPTVVVVHPPVVGRPARLRLLATGSRVREARFKFGPGHTVRGRSVRHTFRRAGRIRYEVTAVVDGSLVRLRPVVRVRRGR